MQLMDVVIRNTAVVSDFFFLFHIFFYFAACPTGWDEWGNSCYKLTTWKAGFYAQEVNYFITCFALAVAGPRAVLNIRRYQRSLSTLIRIPININSNTPRKINTICVPCSNTIIFCASFKLYFCAPSQVSFVPPDFFLFTYFAFSIFRCIKKLLFTQHCRTRAGNRAVGRVVCVMSVCAMISLGKAFQNFLFS